MGWTRPKKRMNLVLENRLMDTFKETFTAVVERVGLVIDGAGVIVIVVGLIVALLKYLLAGGRSADPFRQLRQDLGRGILLGLEFLVAADIIRTVAVTPTLQSVGVLGLIVVIRTFLSMALQVEVEGRLPWQRPPVR
mgnify:CR=1 FL=1|jgi:uncharacterized membrane protein